MTKIISILSSVLVWVFVVITVSIILLGVWNGIELKIGNTEDIFYLNIHSLPLKRFL